jgi:putative FmdB family regulatory protein
MPTYDYKCELCGKQTELFHKMNDVTVYTCSNDVEEGAICHGILKKIITRSNVIIPQHHRADNSDGS